MLDVNTTVLDGRRITLREIVHACNTVPFLGDNRLVIVNDLLVQLQGGKKRGKGGKKGAEAEDTLQDDVNSPHASFLHELQNYLQRLPDTTVLVFVESELLAPNIHCARWHERTMTREGSRSSVRFPRMEGMVRANWRGGSRIERRTKGWNHGRCGPVLAT